MKLHLILKRKWFNLIDEGKKKIEYREKKDFWDKRLNKNFTEVIFHLGYTNKIMRFNINKIFLNDNPDLDIKDMFKKDYYEIHLGKRI